MVQPKRDLIDCLGDDSQSDGSSKAIGRTDIVPRVTARRSINKNLGTVLPLQPPVRTLLTFQKILVQQRGPTLQYHIARRLPASRPIFLGRATCHLSTPRSTRDQVSTRRSTRDQERQQVTLQALPSPTGPLTRPGSHDTSPYRPCSTSTATRMTQAQSPRKRAEIILALSNLQEYRGDAWFGDL